MLCLTVQGKFNGARTSRLNHYRTRHPFDRSQSQRHCSRPSIVAMSVGPISRHTRRFRARCRLAEDRSDRYFLFKMIIRVREGQTNKHDTLIAERDGSFVLSKHHRLPSRAKAPGLEKIPASLGRSHHSDDLERSPPPPTRGSVRKAGSALTSHHTIQTASARCAITLIRLAR